ncbi:MAG: hypothetical protein K9N06_03620 [Candidatus Cloacimonetes bacterium]|nr:hypothetical protein [Candidatus Cloacimonadota bacterium]
MSENIGIYEILTRITVTSEKKIINRERREINEKKKCNLFAGETLRMVANLRNGRLIIDLDSLSHCGGLATLCQVSAKYST